MSPCATPRWYLDRALIGSTAPISFHIYTSVFARLQSDPRGIKPHQRYKSSGYLLANARCHRPGGERYAFQHGDSQRLSPVLSTRGVDERNFTYLCCLAILVDVVVFIPTAATTFLSSWGAGGLRRGSVGHVRRLAGQADRERCKHVVKD